MRVTVWMWADEQLGGKGRSDEILQGYVEEGLTYDEMAQRFEAEHCLKVSRETIRRRLKAAA